MNRTIFRTDSWGRIGVEWRFWRRWLIRRDAIAAKIPASLVLGGISPVDPNFIG